MENLEQSQPATEKPITPEVAGTPTSDVKPQKSSPLLPILLSLLMFLLGGALVFAYFVFIKPAKVVPQPSVLPSPSLTPISSPSPSPELTTEWKTYTNKTYGYKIKYPEDWVLNDKEANEPTNAKLTISKGDFELTLYTNLVGIGGMVLKGVPYTEVIVDGKTLYRQEIFRMMEEEDGSEKCHKSGYGNFKSISFADTPTDIAFKVDEQTWDIAFSFLVKDLCTKDWQKNIEIMDKMTLSLDLPD